MSKPSFGGSQPDFRNNTGRDKSRRITRDLSNLQQEIRVDFDQRISDLNGLMSKFRSLMISDIRTLKAANDQAISDQIAGDADPQSGNEIPTREIPTLTNKIDDSTLADSQIFADSPEKVSDESDSLLNAANDDTDHAGSTAAEEKPDHEPSHLSVLHETARFEAGLYQLNCQLYRFRLELDQELEYREEPLHIHFTEQSALADVLEQITSNKQQEQKS